MANSTQIKITSNQQTLFRLIGIYMTHWSSFELALDCATVKVLGVRPAEVIAMTGGEVVAAKIEFLKSALIEKDHPSKYAAEILLNALQANSIRNSIAHSYYEYGVLDGITFIHRKSRSKVNVHRFTTQEFLDHLEYVSKLASAISKEFGETEADARAFIEAARIQNV